MRSDIRKIAYISRRALALLLTLVMVLAIVPPIDIFAATQDDSSKQIVFDATEGKEYYHKPIVINETTMQRGMKNDKGEYTNVPFEMRNGRYNILIKGEPFSVTVQGLKNVDITFENVTIDRAQTGQSYTIEAGSGAAFWQASEDLATVDSGWTTDRHYVPTCPFWITNGAEVVASFIGNNVFKAGSNMWYIASNTATTIVRPNTTQNTMGNYYYHGYAGIQVNRDSALTIQSGNVEAWGAHQMKTVTTIEQAKSIYITEFDNNNNNDKPPEISTSNWAGNDAAGGAGIGGGTSYNYNRNLSNNGTTYQWATPGSITINAGNVVAVGGFKSAGIGGGVNGAMTAGTITINGDSATSAANKTKVTAIGSFYAAGIGEGDSVPNTRNSTGSNEDFEKLKYSIVINGGEVYAQGGFKASGIGTTDELTSSGQNNDLGLTSGLTIDLNGGDITALSGEAESTNNATAAIGAGDGTNMADYSISIAEGTVVKAVSYSKYAISNIGTSATTAPQNVVDPNTYMYLAYYDRSGDNNLTTNAEREFHLYQIKRTDRGDFMLVVDHTEKVLGHTEHKYVYLGYDEAQNKLYVVDQNGKTVSDSSRQVELFYVAYDDTATDGTPYSAIGDGVDAEGNPIKVDLSSVTGYESLAGKIALLTTKDDVSYYFANPAMKNFTVPAGYTAVAMTLYRPEDFGGRYIFHIPLNNDNNIYAVIEKMSSGDSSGQIVPNFDSHFTMGTPLTPGDPAVNPDKISATLTNLVVSSGTSTHLGLGDAEQIFAPGTKSYTIWLPFGTTEFTVTPSWATANGTTYNVIIREGTGTNNPLANSGTATTYKIGANDIKEIWIEKQDTADRVTANKVIYKLTVRVKAKYTMGLTELNKTYDGMPVIPGIAGMEVREYSEFTVTPVNAGTPTETNPSIGNDNATIFSGKYSNCDTSVIASANGSTITITTTIRGYRSNAWTDFTLTATFNLTEDNAWELSRTERNNTNRFYLNSNNQGTRYYLREVNSRIGLSSSSNGNSLDIVFWSWDTTTETETLEGNTYNQAVSDAKAEVTLALQSASEIGSPVTSSPKNYSETSKTTTTLTIISGGGLSFSDASYEWYRTTTQSGTVTASASLKAITDKSSLLQGETVTYTYYPLTTVNSEKVEGDALAEAPKDAGEYRVKATVNATEFQASGERTFTISQRPITIIGIANWRYYLSEKDLADNAPPYIYITPGTGNDENKFYSGEIRLDNVVEYANGDMDQVELIIAENGMYFADKAVGDLVSNKIVINAAIDATDDVSANYTFAGYPDHGGYKHGELVSGDVYVFHVPGQITYEVDGAMFLYGKLTDADQADFLWYKYYPVIDLTDPDVNLSSYLDFAKNPDGTYVDPRVDYHSPDNVTHAEHIYVRTVNEGEDEARYAVDITFGNMIFQYTKTIWNVNTLEYEKMDNASGETSVWVDPSVAFFAHGEALTNGDILIENRSNRPIEFTATAEINTHCVMVGYDQQTMEFNETLMNQQHRVAARMIWGDTIKWSEKEIKFDSTNSRNTGSVGVATTPTIPIAAAEDVGVGADSTALSNAPGYKIVSIRLFGIPTSSETVGSVTISLKPTN